MKNRKQTDLMEKGLLIFGMSKEDMRKMIREYMGKRRRKTLNDVLKIINKHYLNQNENASFMYKQGWNDGLDVIFAEVSSLKQD